MRIDRKGTVAGWPALLVRRTLQQLRTRFQWGLGELEATASVEAGEARALLRGLLGEGLMEVAGRDAWKVTQAGRLLVLGDFRILEGTEPCHRFSGLLPGEDVRADRSASIPHWPARTDRDAIGAARVKASGPAAASARLPILRERGRMTGG